MLIDREHIGGTCVNDGCTATKTLVASARVAHLSRRGAEHGVRIGDGVSVDTAAVKARKDEVLQALLESRTGPASPEVPLVHEHLSPVARRLGDINRRR